MAGLYWLWRKKRKSGGSGSGSGRKGVGIQWEDPAHLVLQQRTLLPKMGDVMAIALMGSQVR